MMYDELNIAGREFNKFQSLLFPFAYNITGDYLASEDIVVEVLNAHVLNNDADIQNPKGYLVRSVINRAINHKQMLRTRMEQYPGRWLPSPLITEDSIYHATDRDKIMQYSLLVLMEKLNPKERAVFILKETFDFSHEDIAEVLDIKIEHSRQLLKRSKEKVQESEIKGQSPNDANRDMLTALADAILSGDLEKAKALLAKDIACISDGGPHISASKNVLMGPDRVSKLLKAIYGKYFPEGTSVQFAVINHFPAVLFVKDNIVFRVVIFEIADHLINRIYIVLNPDKLHDLNVS